MMPLSHLRRRTFSLLERHEQTDRFSDTFHALVISIISLSLVATVAESVPTIRQEYHGIFRAIELLTAAVLTCELAARVWTAVEQPRFKSRNHVSARLLYFLSIPGLIDLLAIAPLWLGSLINGDLKILLVLRFLRFLKVTQYSPATRALLDSLYRERRALSGCLILIVGAALIAAALMHFAEHEAQPDKFGTKPDSLWWAIVTLGTVGYGDAVPITVLGRLIASLTIFCGLLMVALPVGIVASSFADEVHRRDFLITWSLVARIPLFSNLNATEIAEVMKVLRSSKVSAGAIITRRGDPAHSMYLIVDGEVTLKLKQQHVRLAAGQFFGEIAVLRRAKRSATAIAAVSTRLLILDASDLHGLMVRQPELAVRIKEAARDRLGHAVSIEDNDLSSNEYQSATSQ